MHNKELFKCLECLQEFAKKKQLSRHFNDAHTASDLKIEAKGVKKMKTKPIKKNKEDHQKKQKIKVTKCEEIGFPEPSQPDIKF